MTVNHPENYLIATMKPRDSGKLMRGCAVRKAHAGGHLTTLSVPSFVVVFVVVITDQDTLGRRSFATSASKNGFALSKVCIVSCFMCNSASDDP